jgi:hypothetical protein
MARSEPKRRRSVKATSANAQRPAIRRSHLPWSAGPQPARPGHGPSDVDPPARQHQEHGAVPDQLDGIPGNPATVRDRTPLARAEVRKRKRAPWNTDRSAGCQGGVLPGRRTTRRNQEDHEKTSCGAPVGKHSHCAAPPDVALRVPSGGSASVPEVWLPTGHANITSTISRGYNPTLRVHRGPLAQQTASVSRPAASPVDT